MVTAAQWLPSAVGTEVEWKDLDDVDVVAWPPTREGGLCQAQASGRHMAFVIQL